MAFICGVGERWSPPPNNPERGSTRLPNNVQRVPEWGGGGSSRVGKGLLGDAECSPPSRAPGQTSSARSQRGWMRGSTEIFFFFFWWGARLKWCPADEHLLLFCPELFPSCSIRLVSAFGLFLLLLCSTSGPSRRSRNQLLVFLCLLPFLSHPSCTLFCPNLPRIRRLLSASYSPAVPATSAPTSSSSSSKQATSPSSSTTATTPRPSCVSGMC